MDIKHIGAETDRGFGRPRHRIGNVVKFEIQKNLLIPPFDLLHNLRSAGGKKLLADFKQTDVTGKRLDPCQRLRIIRRVERKDQPVNRPPSRCILHRR